MEKNKHAFVPWLPNICTTLTLFFGFLSMTSSASGAIIKSCYCIFFATITDFLDGRVARLTSSESDFGAEYDSLADLVAFGLSPALICYNFALFKFGRIGWSIAFIYTTATALRLARFNSSKENYDFFIGMPCPAAALFIASFVLINSVHNFNPLYLMLHLIYASFLQVSNIPFQHTKNLSISGKYKALILLAIISMLCLVFTYPSYLIYLLMLLYTIYSIVIFVLY